MRREKKKMSCSSDQTTAWMMALGGAALIGAAFLGGGALSVTPGSEGGGRKEGFWGNPPRTVKVDRVVEASSPLGEGNGDVNYLSVPGSFQAGLSPRFANVGYGPFARQELGNKKPFVGDTPLTEGFASSSSSDPSLLRPFTSSKHVSSSGEVTDQPIVYDRFMVANLKSRGQALGDPIRGDLAITPRPVGWFRTSATPNTDLHPGALNVMGGMTNETNRALTALMRASSGNTRSTLGGVDLMTTPGVPSQELGFSAGSRDVSVRAFP